MTPGSLGVEASASGGGERRKRAAARKASQPLPADVSRRLILGAPFVLCSSGQTQSGSSSSSQGSPRPSSEGSQGDSAAAWKGSAACHATFLTRPSGSPPLGLVLSSEGSTESSQPDTHWTPRHISPRQGRIVAPPRDAGEGQEEGEMGPGKLDKGRSPGSPDDPDSPANGRQWEAGPQLHAITSCHSHASMTLCRPGECVLEPGLGSPSLRLGPLRQFGPDSPTNSCEEELWLSRAPLVCQSKFKAPLPAFWGRRCPSPGRQASLGPVPSTLSAQGLRLSLWGQPRRGRGGIHRDASVTLSRRQGIDTGGWEGQEAAIGSARLMAPEARGSKGKGKGRPPSLGHRASQPVLHGQAPNKGPAPAARGASQRSEASQLEIVLSKEQRWSRKNTSPALPLPLGGNWSSHPADQLPTPFDEGLEAKKNIDQSVSLLDTVTEAVTTSPSRGKPAVGKVSQSMTMDLGGLTSGAGSLQCAVTGIGPEPSLKRQQSLSDTAPGLEGSVTPNRPRAQLGRDKGSTCCRIPRAETADASQLCDWLQSSPHLGTHSLDAEAASVAGAEPPCCAINGGIHPRRLTRTSTPGTWQVGLDFMGSPRAKQGSPSVWSFAPPSSSSTCGQGKADGLARHRSVPSQAARARGRSGALVEKGAAAAADADADAGMNTRSARYGPQSSIMKEEQWTRSFSSKASPANCHASSWSPANWHASSWIPANWHASSWSPAVGQTQPWRRCMSGKLMPRAEVARSRTMEMGDVVMNGRVKADLLSCDSLAAGERQSGSQLRCAWQQQLLPWELQCQQLFRERGGHMERHGEEDEESNAQGRQGLHLDWDGSTGEDLQQEMQAKHRLPLPQVPLSLKQEENRGEMAHKDEEVLLGWSGSQQAFAPPRKFGSARIASDAKREAMRTCQGESLSKPEDQKQRSSLSSAASGAPRSTDGAGSSPVLARVNECNSSGGKISEASESAFLGFQNFRPLQNSLDTLWQSVRAGSVRYATRALSTESRGAGRGPVLRAVAPQKKFLVEYRLGGVLGEGAYGVVRCCFHRSTGRKFACKVVDKSRMDVGDNLERVRLEFAMLRHLSGSRLVAKAEGLFEDRSCLYLVMELCEAGDLCDLLLKAPLLEEREVRGLFRQVLRAVEYCHGKRVLHRDVKLENVLVAKCRWRRPNSQPRCKKGSGEGGSASMSQRDLDRQSCFLEVPALKLADFGSAVILPKGQRACGSVGGSLMYQAPEVLLGRRYGFKADLWSLGVVLYALLSGTFPFVAPTNSLLVGMIRRGIYHMQGPTWAGVSDEAKDVVKSLLQVDPKLRASISEVLAHPWLCSKR